ncbi:DUF433 domain-containing protein [Paludisphaera borealis]|uniref:DUF433 domain-containing protein n=1 Tax=Paludisphaera borealis TaxID=1387353 RepID=A0A1U7CRD1_9BACT|nr:DUF433 domain-containing protein [Paludisphaera borealis]APW61500.1 hypothetical protein BSF38_03015 [Paludisphaera borealis]
MSTIVKYPHLSIDADGTARIDGTRYKVIHLAGEHYHYGWSAEEILRQHPDLRPEQVYAALTYFYDHHESMVGAMSEAADVARREAAKQPISRADLMKRRMNREP